MPDYVTLVCNNLRFQADCDVVCQHSAYFRTALTQNPDSQGWTETELRKIDFSHLPVDQFRLICNCIETNFSKLPPLYASRRHDVLPARYMTVNSFEDLFCSSSPSSSCRFLTYLANLIDLVDALDYLQVDFYPSLFVTSSSSSCEPCLVKRSDLIQCQTHCNKNCLVQLLMLHSVVDDSSGECGQWTSQLALDLGVLFSTYPDLLLKPSRYPSNLPPACLVQIACLLASDHTVLDSEASLLDIVYSWLDKINQLPTLTFPIVRKRLLGLFINTIRPGLLKPPELFIQYTTRLKHLVIDWRDLLDCDALHDLYNTTTKCSVFNCDHRISRPRCDSPCLLIVMPKMQRNFLDLQLINLLTGESIDCLTVTSLLNNAPPLQLPQFDYRLHLRICQINASTSVVVYFNHLTQTLSGFVWSLSTDTVQLLPDLVISAADLAVSPVNSDFTFDASLGHESLYLHYLVRRVGRSSRAFNIRTHCFNLVEWCWAGVESTKLVSLDFNVWLENVRFIDSLDFIDHYGWNWTFVYFVVVRKPSSFSRFTSNIRRSFLYRFRQRYKRPGVQIQELPEAPFNIRECRLMTRQDGGRSYVFALGSCYRNQSANYCLDVTRGKWIGSDECPPDARISYDVLSYRGLCCSTTIDVDRDNWSNRLFHPADCDQLTNAIVATATTTTTTTTDNHWLPSGWKSPPGSSSSSTQRRLLLAGYHPSYSRSLARGFDSPCIWFMPTPSLSRTNSFDHFGPLIDRLSWKFSIHPQPHLCILTVNWNRFKRRVNDKAPPTLNPPWGSCDSD